MADTDPNLEAYKQTWENLRHYSGQRITILTAFVVISGGLFTIALRERGALTLEFVLPFIAGVVIAIAFGLLEWRTNQILEYFADTTEKLAQQLKMTNIRPPRRPGLWKWLAPGVMFTIYGGSIIMWIIAAIVLYKRGINTTVGWSVGD